MKTLATLLLALSLPGSKFAAPARPPIDRPVARQARHGWYVVHGGKWSCRVLLRSGRAAETAARPRLQLRRFPLARRPLQSEIALTVCFLIIIFGVPITQTCIQLCHGERAQFTDLSRYKPTEKNLRQFDETLKDDSWFEQRLRPLMQRIPVQGGGHGLKRRHGPGGMAILSPRCPMPGRA